jgi:hypothetical protein
MTATRVLSNQRITVLLGPETAIADYTQPKLSEILSLTNVSEAIRWSGFDFNIQASTSETDVSLTDAAGSKSRGYTQFGGHIAFFTPKPTDTSSILRVARNIVKTPRTRLAVAIRTITLNSAGAAVGDEWNVFRTITDTNAHERGKVSYAYSIEFKAQDDNGINRVLTAATPSPVLLTPSSTLAVSVGSVQFVTAAFEGVNVTKGATYASSAPAVATVDKNGIITGVSAGTANITATYPGSAPSTALDVTVS